MKATHRQFKSAARGTVRSSSDWDGKTLVQVYNDLRLTLSPKDALGFTRQIRDNRLYALVASNNGLHTSQEAAFTWLLEAHVGFYEAARRVYGNNVPKHITDAYNEARRRNAWRILNQQHRRDVLRAYGPDYDYGC
jgi:hypothetical protein